jgi:hypothetical protein
MFHQNVGAGDRVARIVLGLAVFCLYFVLNGALRWVAVMGVLPLMTGIAGYCPMYALFDFRSCAH